MISEFFGLKLTVAKCRNLIQVDSQGANIYGIVDGSRQIGLEANALEADTIEELMDGIRTREVRFPFIARILKDDMMSHFIVIYTLKGNKFTVGDPGKQHITEITTDWFAEHWLGEVVNFRANQKFRQRDERKGIILKYFRYITDKKKAFAMILAMSLIISFINISTSTIFKYILDDVTKFSMEQVTGEADDENIQEDIQEDIPETSADSGDIMEQSQNTLSDILPHL